MTSSGGGALSTPDVGFRDLRDFKFKHFGFTLAEMMVVMLILSIVMAAMAPVMTTRNKLDQSSPWQWAGNGSDAYYGLGDAQVAMIGQQEAQNEDSGARLVINTGDGKDHILFKSGENVQGRLKFENSGLLLGSLASGNLGSNAIAFGLNTRASNNNTTAVGVNSTATGSDSTSLGSSSVASGTQSSAIGYSAQASGNYSQAFGDEALAGAEGTIAIGSQSSSTTASGISIGMQSSSTNTDAIAIGKLSEASGYQSTVLGADSIASGSDSTAIGNTAKATNSFASAFGYASEASGLNSTALGASAKSSGIYSITLGYNSIATNNYSVVLGANSTASGNYSTALGAYAEASGLKSAALAGSASGGGSTALGSNSEASGDCSTDVGADSKASGSYSTAVGYNAEALGSNNVAIGYNACQNVKGSNKICIGANSGPKSGSSWSYASDTEERIFIGGKSKFNNGAAVLEIHNLSSNSLSGLADNNDTSVVINGNLIVRGNTFLTTREKDSQSSISSNRLSLIERKDEDIRKSHNVNDKWITFWDSLHLYYSDRRLKYVGKESTSGLDKIRELKVFNFTFKKDENKTPHVGVIAQDLQKVFPEAVSKAADGFLKIRFEDMFYAMINAIKELDSRVTTLEQENQQLKEILKQVQDDNRQLQNDNKKLDARLKTLEAKIK